MADQYAVLPGAPDLASIHIIFDHKVWQGTRVNPPESIADISPYESAHISQERMVYKYSTTSSITVGMY